jgi:hypothetical protein
MIHTNNMNAPLPLADRYARFREEVFGSTLEERGAATPEEPLNELELQSLWFGGEFGSAFTTTEGQSVTIRDFGCWNAGAGPDFTGCAIEIAGKTLRGDIELDPDVRDWERHKHSGNTDYDRVVLHVHLEAPAEERFFTRTSQHREVPQVRITREMLARNAMPKSRTAAARLGRCATPLREMEVSRVASLLEASAQYRLQKKSARLHQRVAVQGRDQAILQALAQTLGYRKNQRPFLILAQRLPLKRLLKMETAEREALIFGVSAFLESVRAEETEPRTRAYLRGLWSRWWKLRHDCLRWLEPQSTLKWKLSATRPGNHPQRRLGALAAMLDAWKEVSTPLRDATRWSLVAWRETLLALEHPFWSTHYTLLSEPAAKPVALIGETRVHEMLANVAYPLLLPERPRLWAEYLEMPALLSNQKVVRAALRLFGDSPLARDFDKKLHHHQGLLQIYEDFCLEDDSACAECPFPERLREWQ